MAITQLSVFAENRPGAITDIARILGENKIDMKALSLADTSDYGILRVIVDDTDKARSALTSCSYPVTATEVVGVALEHKPGALAEILGMLDKAEINIEYMYAFMARTADNAYVVLRVADVGGAEQVLTAGGAKVLTAIVEV